jgi:hypothetical protein
MSGQETRRPTPAGAPARPGPVNYIVLVILVCPVALVAAGVGAFLGQWVAVIGWGSGVVVSGTGVGAGLCLLLLGAWVWAYVVCARAPRGDPTAYAEIIASFLADMKARGLSPNVAFPPTFQLAARLGFQVPPPAFVGFRGNFLWSGGLMLALAVSACAVLWWERPNTPPWVMGIVTLLALVMAGLVAALAAAGGLREARKRRLPPWDRYSPSFGVGSAEGSQQGVRS